MEQIMQSICPPLRAVLCAALIVLSPGCTSLTKLFGELEEFYSAQGKRITAGYQKVAGLLIRMKEDPETGKNSELVLQLSEVEEQLDKICRPLQRVSYLRSMREEVHSNLTEEAYRAYDSCESATLEAKEDLYLIAPELATKHRRKP